MANSVYPDQTALIGAVCSGSTLFTSILDSSVMLGNYLQQPTSADNIFGCIFFSGALMVNRDIALESKTTIFFKYFNIVEFLLRVRNSPGLLFKIMHFLPERIHN